MVVWSGAKWVAGIYVIIFTQLVACNLPELPQLVPFQLEEIPFLALPLHLVLEADSERLQLISSHRCRVDTINHGWGVG